MSTIHPLNNKATTYATPATTKLINNIHIQTLCQPPHSTTKATTNANTKRQAANKTTRQPKTRGNLQQTTNHTSREQHNKSSRLIQSLIQPIMANNQPKDPAKKTTQTILPQNADNNTTYGDNLESTTKHHTTLRLYHQNIRGAKQYFSWDSWTQGHHQLQQWQVDIATHVETNTYWKYQNISTAQKIAKQQHTQVHLNTSCSTEPSLEDYHPGGTACSVHGRWTGRVIERVNDTSGLGRWSGYRFEGKQHKNVIVLAVYQPTKSNNKGDNTCYSQQWRILRQQQQNTEPDPRHTLTNDLIQQINQWTKEKTEIIIGMDANSYIGNTKSEIFRLINETSLSDLNPTTTAPPTYARGTKCIDYFLGTPTIKQSVIAYGFLPFYGGAWHSDHRAIFIDLDTRILFEGATSELEKTQHRNVNSNNTSQTNKFFTTLHKENKLQSIEKSPKSSTDSRPMV